ncbi:amino acid transporter [Planktothricoides sp. FACHB-1370]|uniref:Amino acid transporter n=2 Tax=Planktothricoides raciborskii TaxID=132608 RepID=A0ABR8EA61_9CYAN|nr:amino acid transporter [Planktothricoides raciborskii FACHB-1370]MBD2581307.1 amino acid transporter [Planktothricoides raciborskii FACHB-1261]
MVARIMPLKKHHRYLTHWLLKEDRDPANEHHLKHSWWQVMCLTGVDYFSTLGYQPGIAALAAGALSPLATLILVLVTLFGALPIYRRVATMSPHGEGSIAMLEQLLPWWQGKIFVLILLGFAATDFIITITLSAADATAHMIENPFLSGILQGQAVPITLVLIALLGAIFLKGFKEAIGLAVVLVGIYLGLNLVVIGVAGYQIIQDPTVFTSWKTALLNSHGNPLVMVGVATLLFPKLALGLSGFETGVAVMPLVIGSGSDTEAHPTGRIHHTHQLLSTAALIMSFFLVTSSLVTTLLIPPAEFQAGGSANGRALAYLAHQYLGSLFGTIYDLSTMAILWFAGASAMAGLLNLVPRYLPRYGMAPDWARAVRPLVLVYTAIAFIVTLIFEANVEAQGGAYATGVLVLMSSAAVAVTLSVYRQGAGRGQNWVGTVLFGAIAIVFFYTTIVNIIERPDGLHIATFFIAAIIITSLISRVFRSTELRVVGMELDDTARQFIDQLRQQQTRLIAHRPQKGNALEYQLGEKKVRENNHLPSTDPILFLEVQVTDASVFMDVIRIQGVEVEGYRILRMQSAAVPNAIAALLLYIRDRTGILPHVYFGWTEGNPIQYLLRFILFGEGDVPVVTREVLRKAEPDPARRPGIHVG